MLAVRFHFSSPSSICCCCCLLFAIFLSFLVVVVVFFFLNWVALAQHAAWGMRHEAWGMRYEAEAGAAVSFPATAGQTVCNLCSSRSQNQPWAANDVVLAPMGGGGGGGILQEVMSVCDLWTTLCGTPVSLSLSVCVCCKCCSCGCGMPDKILKLAKVCQ